MLETRAKIWIYRITNRHNDLRAAVTKLARLLVTPKQIASGSSTPSNLRFTSTNDLIQTDFYFSSIASPKSVVALRAEPRFSQICSHCSQPLITSDLGLPPPLSAW